MRKLVGWKINQILFDTPFNNTYFQNLPILGVPLCQKLDLFDLRTGHFGRCHWQRGLLSKGVDAPKNACVAAYPGPQNG